MTDASDTHFRHPIGLGADLAGVTTEQQHVVDIIAAGPRGAVPSPFLAMLDIPGLALAIQEVGAKLRFGSTLPDDLREIAILATGAAMQCGYEWNFHAPIAVAAGVEAATIAATRDTQAGPVSEPGASVIALCREVVETGAASPAMLARAIELTGRTGASELIAIAGYYSLLANFIRSGGFDEAFHPL